MIVKNPSLEKIDDEREVSYVLPFCGRKFAASEKLESILEFFREPRPMDGLLEEIFDGNEVIDDLLLNSLLVPFNSTPLSRGLLATNHSIDNWVSSRNISGKNVVFGVPFSHDPFGYLSAAAGSREVLNFIDIDSYAASNYIGDILNFPDEGRASVSDRIYQLVTILQKLNSRPVAIGGDHSISHEIVRALNEIHSDLCVISFDAHADDGQLFATENTQSPLSNANVMSYIEEELGPERICVLGVRTGNYGLENCTHKSFFDQVRQAIKRFSNRPIYITIDIDVVDPIHAPDVNYPSPGGITPSDLITALELIFSSSNVKGCDIVEVCGTNARFNTTAKIAASTLSWVLKQS